MSRRRARAAEPSLFAAEAECARDVVSPDVTHASATQDSALARETPSAARASVHAGIDEAGLGPVLGPLAIGACAFRLPPGVSSLWRELRGVVTRTARDDATRLVVDDSKRVFERTPRGEKRLERTALAFLAQRPDARGLPANARALVRSFTDELCAADEIEREFWARELDTPLPLACERAELEERAAALHGALAANSIELLDAVVRVVPVSALNASFDATANKARTHWLETQVLIAHLWRRHAAEGLELVVDRHGGRMRYADVLAETVPGARVEILGEKVPLSEYLLSAPATSAEPARRMRVVFRERAEQASFAVALASCLAKYLREVHMHAFNAYFAALDPALEPTAGYYTDAHRWLKAARPLLTQASVPERELVRAR